MYMEYSKFCSSIVIFFLDFAANSVFPLFSLHIAPFYDQQHPIYNEPLAELILIKNGLLSPLLIVICIPLYLCLLRPFISQCVPGMLKRIGLGMISMLLSLMVSFMMDTVVHTRDKTGVSSPVMAITGMGTQKGDSESL